MLLEFALGRYHNRKQEVPFKLQSEQETVAFCDAYKGLRAMTSENAGRNPDSALY